MKLYPHQEQSLKFLEKTPHALDLSDPGTGKTRVEIEDINRDPIRTLVFAPKSILQAAWGNDIEKFSDLDYTIAYAENRERAFKAKPTIIVTNHDAVKWAVKHPEHLTGIKRVIIDESTAFKNGAGRGASERAKAMAKLAHQMEIRRLLTGTFTSNTILDAWHQVFIADEGKRLGKSFYQFRNEVCVPIQVGPSTDHIEWADKLGIEAVVFELIKDIAIRHHRDDCLALPANHTYTIEYNLTKKHLDAYKKLQRDSLLELPDGSYIDAVHAASLRNKLLQCASGAIYAGDGSYKLIDPGRYEFLTDLVREREQCIIAFNWKHQRDELIKNFNKAKLAFGVIDGNTNHTNRTNAVDRFQIGDLRVLLLHPQSAAHGLTLTAGTSTLWASPTYNPEWFTQLNARIDRAGQTQKTETVLTCATNTIESEVYQVLQGRLNRRDLLLNLAALKEAA